jgi:hypothetical protein
MFRKETIEELVFISNKLYEITFPVRVETNLSSIFDEENSKLKYKIKLKTPHLFKVWMIELFMIFS